MLRLRNLIPLSASSKRRTGGSDSLSHSSAEVLEDRALLSTITVTSADDTTEIDGAVTLREAIGAANADLSLDGSEAGSGFDTIVFDPSLAGQTIVLDGAELVITSDISIDAGNNGITIDGDNSSRLFRVEIGQSLNLVSLNLTNGLTVGSNSILSPTSIPFAGDGGAIYSNAGHVTLRETTIENSRAQGATATSLEDGGDGRGGAIAAFGGTVTLLNSQLIENDAVGGTGSGVSAAGDGFGGGLHAENAIVNLRDSTIDGNTAGDPAGTITITSTGVGYGGGIAVVRSNVAIESSTISRNFAEENGGGIYKDGDSSLNLSNVTVSGNEATNGGGIFQTGAGQTSIAYTTIFGNTATQTGGGIHNSAQVTIGNSILAGNIATDNAEVRENSDGFVSAGYNIFGDVVGVFIEGDLDTIQTGVDALTVLEPSLLNNGGPTETHTLIVGSPALDAGLAVAAPAHDQRGVARPAFGASDIGAVEISENEARDVVGSLDLSLDLRTDGNLYENWGGLGEKWLNSPSGHWYFILPSGSVYRWDGTAQTASGTLVANLSSVVHDAPDLLYNGSAAKLDFDLGLHTSGNFFTNWGGAGEKWVRAANNDWYFIMPSGDFFRWDGSATAAEAIDSSTLVTTLETKFHENPNLLVDAYTISTDRWYDFQEGTSDFFNWGGRSEKWFRGAQNEQYFILPGGDVFRWDGSQSASGTLVVSTDPATYTDPSTLVNAVDDVFAEWVGP